MFSDHTRRSIIALACIDEGVTDTEKDALQGVLLGRRTASSAVVRYKDAAKRLGLSVPTIKRLVKSGRLQGVKGIGTRYCGISEESIERYSA